MQKGTCLGFSSPVSKNPSTSHTAQFQEHFTYTYAYYKTPRDKSANQIILQWCIQLHIFSINSMSALLIQKENKGIHKYRKTNKISKISQLCSSCPSHAINKLLYNDPIEGITFITRITQYDMVESHQGFFQCRKGRNTVFKQINIWQQKGEEKRQSGKFKEEGGGGGYQTVINLSNSRRLRSNACFTILLFFESIYHSQKKRAYNTQINPCENNQYLRFHFSKCFQAANIHVGHIHLAPWTSLQLFD